MQREHIARLLPDVFQRTLASEFWRGEKGDGSLLGALLGVMQDLHTPVELTLANLAKAFQPDDAPVSFLPFLAGWLDLERFLDRDGHYPPGNERLRALILEAASLYRMRGTRQGLERFLETATGVSGFQVNAAKDQPFHLLVSIPPRAEPLREFVHLVVQAEKPAYATCELLPHGKSSAAGGAATGELLPHLESPAAGGGDNSQVLPGDDPPSGEGA